MGIHTLICHLGCPWSHWARRKTTLSMLNDQYIRRPVDQRSVKNFLAGGRYTVFTPTRATIAAAAAAPSKGAFRALAAASSYIASATMRMPWRCANGWLPQAHGLAAPCTDRPTCGTRCTAVRTERRRPEGGGVAHRCCSGSRMARSPAARRAEHLC